MHKQAPRFEWHIVESDAAWEQMQEPLLPDRAPTANHRRRLQHFFGRVAALFLLLASVDGDGRTNRVALPQPAPAVMAMSQPAPNTFAPGSDSWVASTISDQAAAAWSRHFAPDNRALRAAIQPYTPTTHLDVASDTGDVHGDQAVAHVVIYTEHGVLWQSVTLSPYHEAYQSTNSINCAC